MVGLGLPETLVLDHLAIAAACGLLLGYGSVLLSNCFPLSEAPLPKGSLGGKALVLLASACFALTVVLLIGFILFATAWAPALIAAGLALLGGPLLFQGLPQRLAGGLPGLCALIAAQAVLLTLLTRALIA